jgi:hypothetical protein
MLNLLEEGTPPACFLIERPAILTPCYIIIFLLALIASISHTDFSLVPRKPPSLGSLPHSCSLYFSRWFPLCDYFLPISFKNKLSQLFLDTFSQSMRTPLHRFPQVPCTTPLVDFRPTFRFFRPSVNQSITPIPPSMYLPPGFSFDFHSALPTNISVTFIGLNL